MNHQINRIKYISKSGMAAVAIILVTGCTSNQKMEDQSDTTALATDTISTIASSQTDTAMQTNMNTLSGQEKAEGWKLLFDGKTTSGWRGYNQKTFPATGWEVKDGMLTVLKPVGEAQAGGDIITENQYENFELKFDFKLTPVANSGILYMIKEQPETRSWHSAPEYQLIDEEGYAKISPEFNMATHRTGENYDLQAAPADYSKPIGEWNEGRIMVNKGKVEHWLNGQKTIEYDVNSQQWKDLVKKSKFGKLKEYGKNKKGYIGIQEHGNTVYFRNIKIKEL